LAILQFVSVVLNDEFIITTCLCLAENDGGDGEFGADGEKKKRQTRGGRGVVKVKQKQDVEKRICLSRACRGKRKFVTVITGLATYGESMNQALAAHWLRFLILSGKVQWFVAV